MSRLKARGHTVYHQDLDNEASSQCRIHSGHHAEDWKATYQLLPLDIHRHNLAEHAIQTFKAHFLSILAGISKSFPNYLWDKSSPSTFSVKRILMPLLCLPGSTTTMHHSTLTQHQYSLAVALSSFTTSRTNVHPGPSVDATASTLVPSYLTTVASKSWTPTPKL
jgi:hypothetical protein